MRAFFVPVADRPECAAALQTAFDLARRLQASVHGCHIRPHTDSKVTLPKDLNQIVNPEETWNTLSRGKNSGKSRRGARVLFEGVADHFGYDVAKRPGRKPVALWSERVGSPDKLLAIHGPVSDLIVVSRPASRTSKLARHFMLSSLLYTSQPVLIVPPRQKKPVGQNIAIGWNDSNEAAASVAACMPMLQQAQTVTIIQGGVPDPVGPGVAQLKHYLAHYGVKTRLIKAERQLSHTEALLKGYRDAEADVLVMGAYSRSRFAQRLLGGVTEHMLHKAGIPVLLKHH